MGIINMMIVVPMLIETVTFGQVYERFLGANPTNAIMFAGALLFIAAVAMLWIRPPKPEEQSEHMPLTVSALTRSGSTALR